MSNKELALNLIDQLLSLDKKNDKEFIRLKKIEDKDFKHSGESAIAFHLKILKELVESL